MYLKMPKACSEMMRYNEAAHSLSLFLCMNHEIVNLQVWIFSVFFCILLTAIRLFHLH